MQSAEDFQIVMINRYLERGTTDIVRIIVGKKNRTLNEISGNWVIFGLFQASGRVIKECDNDLNASTVIFSNLPQIDFDLADLFRGLIKITIMRVKSVYR